MGGGGGGPLLTGGGGYELGVCHLKADIKVLDRHPTTRQTPNYKTDTQLVDKRTISRQMPDYWTDTQVNQLLDRNPTTTSVICL